MCVTATCTACAPGRMALLRIIVISGHAEVEAANDISCFIRSRRSRQSVPCQWDLPARGSCLRPSELQTHTVLRSSTSNRQPCRYTCRSLEVKTTTETRRHVLFGVFYSMRKALILLDFFFFLEMWLQLLHSYFPPHHQVLFRATLIG